jgi:two-component system, chemotaxis family, chemotaxis protein CheY
MLRIREEPVKPGYLSNKIAENLRQMLPMVPGALTNSGVAISVKVSNSHAAWALRKSLTRLVFNRSTAPHEGLRVSVSASLEGKTVMVVDDDQSMRMLICRMLARLKITNLVEATGGQQALQELERAAAPFDLIICDWNMPGMSGIELFDRVHALKPGVPFLMLTGRADADSVIAAKRAGVPAYVVKPVSPEELKAKVSYLLTKGA